MQAKIACFVQDFDAPGLPYSAPRRGRGNCFMLANFLFPPHMAQGPRDFTPCWFFIVEPGVAAILPSEENTRVAENYFPFAVCKEDDVLDMAQDELMGLK